MNELLTRLKADARAAQMARNFTESALINTVVGEVENIPASRKLKAGESTWPATEDEVKKVLLTFMKNIQATIKILADRGRSTEKEEGELAVLSRYVSAPKVVTEDEVRELVMEIIPTLADRSPKQMGVIMGKVKERYPDVDAKMASMIVKAAL